LKTASAQSSLPFRRKHIAFIDGKQEEKPEYLPAFQLADQNERSAWYAAPGMPFSLTKSETGIGPVF